MFLRPSYFLMALIIIFIAKCNWLIIKIPAILIVILLTSFKERIDLIFWTLPRDIRFYYRMNVMQSVMKKYKNSNNSVVDIFRDNLEKDPYKQCFIFDDDIWIMNDVESYSNRIANIFQSSGLKKGDTASLLMNNQPEYFCIWLGLAKLGVVTALINVNIHGNSLQHCVLSVNSKILIFGSEFIDVVNDIQLDEVALYQMGGSNNSNKILLLKELLQKASCKSPTVVNSAGYKDKLLYIFTSGTTGLPKAAVLPNSKFILTALALKILLDIGSKDILYNPLPLYHTSGGCLGAGNVITGGATVVLKKKFSASSYITDCIKYHCTAGLYIGEMCRYILAVPPRYEDTKHKLRFMIGNGLRPTIWKLFIERFKVPNIMEFYGATEGNVNIVNMDNTLGAVGALPVCVPRKWLPLAVIKYDDEKDEPIRDKNGFCILTEPNEVGMFIGFITSNDPTRQFHGYVKKEDTKKKIISNVFKNDDMAFLSGDLVSMDEKGYIYFKDRTGDTFRWKGENVSTSEVEAIISKITDLRDSIVYGVQVGELEGRVGMTAIVDPESQLNIDKFAQLIDKSLPTYARPIFLRILNNLEMTGTFKMKKIDLQKEGFNPNIIHDKLFFRHKSTFVQLNAELYNNIISGNIKL